MFSIKIKFQRKTFSLDVNINLKPGSITALIGPSGSGKTSLMRLIAGLERPHSGFIRSNQHFLYQSENQIFVSPQKRNVGLMFQDYALFDHLNITENIAYGVEKSRRKRVVSYWLQRINLTQRAKDFPPMLSGGEKQRVALARALACEPEILLLDEPFSALDSALRHELRREILSLIKGSGIPVLIATHDLEEAQLIADQVSVLINGRIVCDGDVSKVFQNPGSIAAARALGWQNILLVNQTTGSRVSGSWGELMLSQAPQTNVLALGLPKGGIIFQSEQKTENRLKVKIERIITFNDCKLLEIKLIDDTSLVFEVRNELNNIKLNQFISISFDTSNIVQFFR